MNEFAIEMRRRAVQAMRQVYRREATPATDPVLELIALLLEDEAGDVSSRSDCSITTEQWSTWNQLAMDREQELVAATMRVLEAERIALPSQADAMRQWAAWLVAATLDRLEMM